MRGRFTGIMLALIVSAICNVGVAATSPGQPRCGPGGSNYPHAAVVKNVYGEGANQYWIFEPAVPAPVSAPLIVFNHGWGAVNPRSYGAWIEHLVRRGNIVVYPRYQEQWRYPPEEIAGNAIRAVKDAIARLGAGRHVKPELSKFAIVGHSAGGQTTANMAAQARETGLPEPKAIMCVQPGKSWNKMERARIPLEDLGKIPERVLLLAVVGDKDTLARDIDAKRIFNEATRIPPANKDFIVLVSDDHGKPALVADHFAPCALDSAYDSGEKRPPQDPQGSALSRLKETLSSRAIERSGAHDFPRLEGGSHSADALDYYGLWKLFDGLCDAAFYGKNREYALGNTPQQRCMGKWSDEVPVKELIVADTP